MNILLQFVRNTVTAIFEILDLAMLLRALLSWIAGPESLVMDFLFAITEPLITPVRMVCDRFGWFESIPIDMPFIISIFLLALVESAVEMISI